MAKNDVILLDGIIDQRLAESLPSGERDEVFEFFVLEEILKDYDLSRDEIETGWVDGRNDGGIDGFYILINGHLVEDSSDFVWPKSNAAIDVWLVTCKHHSTFQQAPLDNLFATIHELFDLALNEHELRGSYSEQLLNARSLFQTAYRRLSIGRPIINFNFVYASRGDTNHIGDSVATRANQIKDAISRLFSSCNSRFDFVGANELVQLHRRAKTFSLSLPFIEHLATGKNSYVLLVKLIDYWKFVSDENGHLRRYLFDSNVRDFLGENQVNEDIATSLADPTAPDFWWLNNGVTVLATNATVPGKTIQLQDIQIVNGLQTTEIIFRHFQKGSSASLDRALLVKIIVSSNADVRDRIIRATNNQSLVEVAALHATDKIQRDIENILERYDWYYERRRNYYRNIGKSQARFITPLYLAGAAVALVLKNPVRATRLKSKFMRTRSGYEAVFSEQFPIEVWPVLAQIYKQVDSIMGRVFSIKSRGERFISRWRPLISLLLVARRMKTFAYTTSQLLDMKSVDISEDEVVDMWSVIVHGTKDPDRKVKPNHTVIHECCKEAARRYELHGLEDVCRRDIFSQPDIASDSRLLPADFVSAVEMLLPPWPRN